VTTPAEPDRALPRSLVKWIGGVAVFFFVLGLVLRVIPLFDANGRLFQQYPTEDGYLTLTIARNLGMGKGMTVSDGTVATNGTQPLVTFVWAGAFAVVGGDRALGVGLVLVLEIVIAGFTSLMIAALVRELFGRDPFTKALSWLGAGLWFASPVALPHTMNCLETGAYAAVIAWVLFAFVKRSAKPGPWSWRDVLVMGCSLGVAFLVRNDAVFLCAAVALAHLWIRNGASFQRRFVELAGMGALALVLATPWLAYNLSFGHLVPISGRAEAEAVGFAENLRSVPAVMAESIGLFVLIPQDLEERLPVVVGATLCVAFVAFRLVRALRKSDSTVLHRAGIVALCYSSILCVYYGLFFGAGWFLNRYLFPITPLTAVLWAAFIGSALRARLPVVRPALVGALAVCTLFVLGHGYRGHVKGSRHQHIQVVEWVNANVAPHQWVGAIQSGKLGFFHARTLNLDGKVSPQALAARKADRIPDYVNEKKVDFLVDWAGIASWARLPGFKSFELIVNDPVENLAMLRRRGALTIDEARRIGKATP
jgi:hypothetical protein